MKYSEKINKLATYFEEKMLKYAEEVDSTMITLITRPLVNDTLTKIKFNDIIQKSVQSIANKMQTDFHGSLTIDTWVTNAKMTAGKWKVDPSSGLVVKGSLSRDLSIQTTIVKVNNMIINALTKALDNATAKKMIVGSEITNHETGINEVSVNV